MRDEINVTIKREYIENLLGEKLSDKHWTVMSDEILSIIDHYVDTDVPLVYNDIESITEEYDEYVRNG